MCSTHRGASRPHVVVMPVVEVTYSQSVADETLLNLSAVLPHAVSRAVECPEEPYDGRLRPGDVEVRYRSTGPYDTAGLDVVIEVRSKRSERRAQNRQQRCDQLCEAVASVIGTTTVGDYLSLPVTAWQQPE